MIPTKRDELKMMQRPQNWPQWPYLPVKNRRILDQHNIPLCGILIEQSDGVKPVIYLTNLFSIAESDFVFDKIERREYQTFEELLQAGWVVD